MYTDLEKYFEDCQNCGECCKIPGIFLPEQVDLLGEHLNLNREQLFRKYFIAELFAPNIQSVPVFVISPVTADGSGERFPNLLSDREFENINHLHCIFRDNGTMSCRIHEFKPFGCHLLICGKMTKAKPITLNKTYYYHKWLDSQKILFSIFPDLESAYHKLLSILSGLPKTEEERGMALDKGNEVINVEMANIMNGHPNLGRPFYF